MGKHADEGHELGVAGGLAALSLDALSSVAYGPEAMVVVLVAAGTGALRFTVPLTLVITGMLNLNHLFQSRAGKLSATFTYVLGIKISLYIAMLMTLGVAMRAIPAMRSELERNVANAIPRAMRTMLRVHLAIIVMGGVAMILGLWLVGS